ncbi:MAG: dTMP kinase [Candidatus Entotheonellia bacterium]
MTPYQSLARGVLVALEGIDGAGKSTQGRCLEGIFKEKGYEVMYLHEPSDSPWGRRLRELKRLGHRSLSPSQELDLFLQDRRYDSAAHIQPALAARKFVLMDRYYFSTIAYQGALGIDPDYIRRLNETFAPVPDLVFILMISPTEGLDRIRRSRGRTDDVFEREEYLKKVDEVFRTLQGPHIHPIDADQSIDVVTAVLQRTIQDTLSMCSLAPPSQGRE